LRNEQLSLQNLHTLPINIPGHNNLPDSESTSTVPNVQNPKPSPPLLTVRRRKTGTPFFLSQDRIYNYLLKYSEQIRTKLWEKDLDYEKAVWHKFDELRTFNGHALPSPTIVTPPEEFQV